jgi:hypothetical protein
MKKENLIKAALIFGGGFLLFMLLKPKKKDLEKKSFIQEKPQEPTTEPKFTEEQYQNAEIVANAYAEALKNQETPENLTELNKELMKEFNMRCYLDKSSKLVVCDTKGNTILTK